MNNQDIVTIIKEAIHPNIGTPKQKSGFSNLEKRLCQKCAGQGQINDDDGLPYKKCPACNGTGLVKSLYKEAVDASGYISYSEDDAKRLQTLLSLKFPFVNVQRSTLGGASRASLSAAVSADAKEDWKNGIFHNSRYCIFSISNGKLEALARDRTAWQTRKTTVADMDQASQKICRMAPLKESVNENLRNR